LHQEADTGFIDFLREP